MLLTTPLLLAALLQAPADPIAAAARGLTAVVEEDGRPDTRLLTLETRRCRTVVAGVGRMWVIDWHRPARVALEDTFLFVDAAPVRIAIVADTSRQGQAARLRRLARAMNAATRRCAG